MEQSKKACDRASLNGHQMPEDKQSGITSNPPLHAVRRYRRMVGALVIASMVLALAACGGGASGGSAATKTPAATAAAESNPAVVKAQELFTTNKCISCHGVDLAGKVGPKTNLQKVGSRLSSEQIANKIKNGGGGMPVYKTTISEEEIGLLSDWLNSKK
ncbi:cytochrome c551 [Paenibacillus sp. V4I3]|uniref:c-type cytochrome n=1 Tax=Paenibacillus sp. V4I3 TaxID=3042305 RepID=UPI002788DBD6|nr:cytochrome c [Paenibacillus sp. V4I3]MDQ0871730.1 cytochrome c551 [Paenibacillus sp. V4I3]